jgi:O-antigen/teichoic acid export membrane protein
VHLGHRLKLSRFRRAFVSTFVLDVMARAVSAGAVVVLLRALAVREYAFIVLFLAVGQFLGSAAAGGLRMRHLRMEAERVSRGLDEPSFFPTALVGGTSFIGALGLLALAAVAIGGLGGPSGEAAAFVALASAFAIGHAATELAIYHHQAHLAFKRAGTIGVVRNALLLGVAIVAASGLLRSGHEIALGFALAMVALALAVCVPLLAPRSSVRLERRLGFGAESGWLTIYNLVSAGFTSVDVFIVAAILSRADVASFGAAQRYLAIALGAAPALLAVFRVRTVQQDVLDSPGAQRHLLLAWARQTAPPIAAAVALGVVAAPLLVPIVDGGRYPDSVPILQVFLAIAFSTYICMPASSLLLAQLRYRELALIWTAGLAVNTVGDFMVGPVFGVVGIAVVSTTVYVLVHATLTVTALRAISASSRPGARRRQAASA